MTLSTHDAEAHELDANLAEAMDKIAGR